MFIHPRFSLICHRFFIGNYHLRSKLSQPGLDSSERELSFFAVIYFFVKNPGSINMFKLKFFFCLFLLSTSSICVAEWLTLTPQSLAQYEIVGPNALGEEGLYVKHVSSFPTSLGCTKNQFIIITDPKLADRVLSSIMFSIASNKTMKFYADSCKNNIPHASMFMLIP